MFSCEAAGIGAVISGHAVIFVFEAQRQ